MLITVTNTSGATMNDLDSISGGSGPSGLLATGGARKYPLPFPFGHIGALANSGTKQLPVHMRDFRKRNQAETFEPGEEWNQLIQKGWVTLAVADETTDRDAEDQSVPVIA